MTKNTEIVIESDAGSITVAQPTKIFIGQCPDCKLPSRFEPDFPAVNTVSKFTTNCLHCNTLMTAERLWATETEGSCDTRCMCATGDTCECACGGDNHAGAYRFNRFKSEETESAIQRLLAQREKTEKRRIARETKKRENAARAFNEWRDALNIADSALVSWLSFYENVQDHAILVDFRLRMMPIPSNPVKYPARPLTEKQMDLAWKIVQRMSDECEREVSEKLSAKPVPEGRMTITGQVVSRRIDSQETGYYGRSVSVYKILVKCDGFKIWGNCPSDLITHIFPHQEYGAAVRNEKLPEDLFVTFTATLKRSERDESFGFFKIAKNASVADTHEMSVSNPHKRVSKRQSAEKPAHSTETQSETATPSEKRSARSSGSHADCTHEPSKSARAKCRRERQSK